MSIRQPLAHTKLPASTVPIPDVSRNKSQVEVVDAWNKSFKTIDTHNAYPDSHDLPSFTSLKQYEPHEFTFERTTVDTRKKMPHVAYTDKFTQSSRNEQLAPVFNRPSYKDVLDRDPRYTVKDVRADNAIQSWLSEK